MNELKDKCVLVTGAGGFIGGHVVKRLKEVGCKSIIATDIKHIDDWHQAHEESTSELPYCIDLTDQYEVNDLFNDYVGDRSIDIVIHLAADMGGMGFIENHKLDCMMSGLMNFNLLRALNKRMSRCRLFYSSSACVYPGYLQNDKGVDHSQLSLEEFDAYPADPEDGYGWEKLFSERLCRHFTEETSMSCCVGRFHNIYGHEGTWVGGREKAPAAICRKVATAKLMGHPDIVVWGDGTQLRSFTYIDDCVDGIFKLLLSEFDGPVNIGSSEMVTINELVDMVADIAGISVNKIYDTSAPKGVHGRNSDNTLIKEKLGWEPSISLRSGMEKTYAWVFEQVKNKMENNK